MSTHIQYIGSDPTWGPQQQVARRHAIEQTSVTLGDSSQSDANVRDRSRDPGANPYQLRWRNSTVSVIQANAQQQRKRLSTNELGLTDSDPTIRPNYQAANPYQLRYRLRADDTAEAMKQWLFNRSNTNDLGTTNADATIRPSYQDPHQRRHLDPAWPAITATSQWSRTRLNSNNLGTTDADPTIQMPWVYSHPHSLYKRDPTVSAIETVEQLRRKRLSTNELGTADQDTSIRPVYQDPHQRRHTDPAWYVQPTLSWLRLRLTTNDLGTANQDVTIRPNWQMANPYHLYQRPSTISAIEAWHQQLHLWEASTPIDIDADPTVTLPPRQPPTIRRVDYAPYARRPLADQSDQGTVATTPTTDTSQPGGRNGPANPREWALHQAQREQVRREDDEILFLI